MVLTGVLWYAALLRPIVGYLRSQWLHEDAGAGDSLLSWDGLTSLLMAQADGPDPLATMFDSHPTGVRSRWFSWVCGRSSAPGGLAPPVDWLLSAEVLGAITILILASLPAGAESFTLRLVGLDKILPADETLDAKSHFVVDKAGRRIRQRATLVEAQEEERQIEAAQAQQRALAEEKRRQQAEAQFGEESFEEDDGGDFDDAMPVFALGSARTTAVTAQQDEMEQKQPVLSAGVPAGTNMLQSRPPPAGEAAAAAEVEREEEPARLGGSAVDGLAASAQQQPQQQEEEEQEEPVVQLKSAAPEAAAGAGNDDEVEEVEEVEAPAFTRGTEAAPVDLARAAVGALALPLDPAWDKGGLTHSWCRLSTGGFKIRGKKYIEDRKKVPSNVRPVFTTAHVEVFRSHKGPVGDVAGSKGSYLWHARQAGDDRAYLIVNFQCPAPQRVHLVIYYVVPHEFSEQDGVGSHTRMAWRRFFESGEGAEQARYRNARWKIIPKVSEGSWVVSSAVGSKPALVANKLDHTWIIRRGPQRARQAGQAGPSQPQGCPEHPLGPFMEIDCDVASQAVANQLGGLMASWAKSFQMDLCFTIEGRDESELPETIMTGMRLGRLDLSKIAAISEDDDYQAFCSKGLD